MLVGALLRARCPCGRDAHPLRVLLAAFAAGSRFRVAGHSLLGWSAALRNRGNVAFEVDRAAVEGHEIPRTDTVRWAHSRAVDVYLAAAHGVRGQRAGLEESSAEEPAVEARSSGPALASVVGLVGAAHRAQAQDTSRPALTTERRGLKPLQ